MPRTAARPHDKDFLILWLDIAPANYRRHEPPRVIAHDIIRRHDMSDALTAAANMLRAGRSGAAHAYGYVVAPIKGGAS